jgi:uncharacterized damage-inducible protein DinB
MNSKENELAALANSNAAFLDAARAFPAERRTLKPSERAFSATEIVYHMLAVEKLWQSRLQRLISGESREFIAMDPDKEAIDDSYNSKDFSEGLEDLLEARRRSLELFRSLLDEQFELTGIHTKYGEMSIDRIMEIMTAHDLQHAKQLERTEQELLAMGAAS